MLLANSTSFPIVAAALSSLTIPLLALPASAITPESTTPYYPPLSRAGSAVPRNPYPEGSPVSVSALAVLVDAFVRAAEIRLPEAEDAENAEEEKKPKVTKGDPARKADLHFLASVFINVSGVGHLSSMIFRLGGLTGLSGFRRRLPGGNSSSLQHHQCPSQQMARLNTLSAS